MGDNPPIFVPYMSWGIDAWGVFTWGGNTATVFGVPSPFGLDSVIPLGSIRVRVRWTAPPLMTNPAGGSDALNPAAYLLTGPGGVTIAVASASTVAADSEVTDLYLTQPLTPGVWTLAILHAIQAATDSRTLDLPAQTSFQYANFLQEAANRGALNTSTQDELSLAFHPVYRKKAKWQGVIAALATGLQANQDLADAALRQLWPATASDGYLTTLGFEVGVPRPEDVGLSDDIYRQLVIRLGARRLVEDAFLDVLEAFYGVDATRAYVDTGALEPFVLGDDDVLEFTLDRRTPIRVVFTRPEFQTLRRAGALEVAVAITRACAAAGTAAYAIPVLDADTGAQRVRLYSGRRGSASTVQITGGTAQAALGFPTLIAPTDPLTPLPTWAVTVQGEGVVRYQPATDTVYNLREVQPGDYLIVLGLEFAPPNRGSFPVVGVTYRIDGGVLTQYVDVANPTGTTEASITQVVAESVWVFRPTTADIYSNPTYALPSPQEGSMRVRIPATSAAVVRRAGLAAYLHTADAIPVDAWTRYADGTTTVHTATPHGLQAGAVVALEDLVLPAPAVPAPTGGSGGGALDGSLSSVGTGSASPVTHWVRDTATGRALTAVARDLQGGVWSVGGEEEFNPIGITARTYIDRFQVTAAVTATGTTSANHTYRWDRTSFGGGTFAALGRSIAVLDHPLRWNQLLVVGGYALTPWQAFQDVPLLATAGVAQVAYVGAAHHTFTAVTSPPVPFADASTYAVPYPIAKVLVVGGSRYVNAAEPGLNVASTQVLTYNEAANTWSTLTSMPAARLQASLAGLPNNEVLVIGGRRPATPNLSNPTGLVWWDFDDTPAAAATFVGPVNIPSNGNPRPVGKLGWGVRTSLAMVASAGGAQTALNTELLTGTYTITGWMTSKTGNVLRNGVGVWAVQADNTLIAFGVDPADDKFYIRWRQGVGGTVITQKSTTTRAAAMPIPHQDTYPRYYHFAIVRTTAGGTASFTLYLNGVQTDVLTGTAPDGGTNGVWSFGATDGSIAGFNGAIDHVGISPSALTARQIADLYATQVGVTYDHILKMDQSPVGTVLHSCDVVDATTGWKRRTGPMAFARFAGGVAVLPDGRVVVAGGVGYPASYGPSAASQRQLELRSAEIYDPRTGLWDRLPDMADPHSYPLCVYVPGSDRVYVAGGFTSQRTEYLDLRSMTWKTSPAKLPAVAARGGGALAGTGIPLLVGGGSIAAGVETTTAQSQHLDPASETVRAGGVGGWLTVATTPDGSTFTLRRPRGGWGVGTAAATPVAAPVSDGTPGPYLLDPLGAGGVTATTGVTADRLTAGARYPSLRLGSGQAAAFPAEGGWLVLGYGYPYQVGPVRYNHRTDPDTLAFDAGLTLPRTVPAGAEVTLLTGPEPYVPADPPAAGAFYATATPSARAAAIQFLEGVSAGGIDLEIVTTYPGDRGLGGEGRPTSGAQKLSDVVTVFGPDDPTADLQEARDGS